MFEIRPACVDDAETILDLQKRAFAAEARLYDDWEIPPLTQSIDSLREDIANQTVLKAVQDGTIVGSVRGALRGTACVVGRLVVEPGLQRRGIGSALLAVLETAFPAATSFELVTGSRSDGNIRLYRRHGYVISRRECYSDRIMLVCMRKPGLAAA